MCCFKNTKYFCKSCISSQLRVIFGIYFFRTLSELEAAQLDFYTANAALCKEQWKVAQQQVKTLSAQEEFYKHATKKLRDDDVSCLLNLFTEQYVFLLLLCVNLLLLPFKKMVP